MVSVDSASARYRVKAAGTLCAECARWCRRGCSSIGTKAIAPGRIDVLPSQWHVSAEPDSLDAEWSTCASVSTHRSGHDDCEGPSYSCRNAACATAASTPQQQCSVWARAHLCCRAQALALLSACSQGTTRFMHHASKSIKSLVVRIDILFSHFWGSNLSQKDPRSRPMLLNWLGTGDSQSPVTLSHQFQKGT